MKYSEINLARGLVHSSRKRRLLYHGMQLYLALMTLLLAIVIWQAVVNLKKGLEYYQETRAVQARFAADYPGYPAMLDYADQLLQTLAANKKTADEIGRTLPRRVYSVLPVLKSIINQPYSRALHKLAFAQDEKGRPILEFSIAVPSSQSGPSSEFIRNWQNDPDLTRQFIAITPTTTTRGHLGNEEIFVMSYRGTFKE